MLALLALASLVSASTIPPRSPSPAAQPATVPLSHTPHGRRELDDDGTIRSWALAEKRRVDRRYLAGTPEHLRKRADAFSLTLQNENQDASYSGSVSIGTPAQTFDLILDTGSSDLWVAGNSCTSSACTSTTTFNPAASSTFNNQTRSFEISYGSGDASGYLATDTVALGGESVNNQVFAVVTDTDPGLISSPISGLLGLGFQALAQSNSPPWWQTLAAQWPEPLFAFKMARFRNITTATAVEEQGGTVNFGALDSSLYTGDINYVTVTEQTYWRIPCLGMTVGGNSVDIATSGASPSAAIDTGTTLIAVPTATAQALYAALSSEAQAVTESGFQGYWQYPCDLNVEVALNFGGVSYTISNGDFNIGRLSRNSNLCLGGIYGTDLGSTSTIQWIVGATFLKNVYSIYKYSKANSGSQVGFASLANGGTVSSTTSNNTSNSTSNSAGTGSSSSSSSASSRIASSGATIAGIVALVALIV